MKHYRQNNITWKTLVTIYEDFRCTITARGAKETLCLLIKNSLEKKDVQSLIEIGIDKKEAQKALQYIKKKETM